MDAPLILHPEPDDAGYERDFALWIERQLALIGARQYQQLDWDNLVEELEAMGRSERHQLESRIETLLMHLLKCQFQPEQESGSWLGTIREQRSKISRILKSSPSLRRWLADAAAHVYESARDRASLETGLSPSAFPTSNPYTIEQLLDTTFTP